MEKSRSTPALASWNDGATKRSIIDFVARVTQSGSRDFVAAEDRVAVFDNDGTLWCEKPLPIQGDFLMRRIKEMVDRDPSLRTRQPWKAVAEDDHAWLGNAITKHYHGDDDDLKAMSAGLLQAYAGSTIEEFEVTATEFFRRARHPRFDRSYLRCVYQPMIELLQFLTANGFSTYVATGGGRDFMRPVTQELYDIPPDRVIGSSAALQFREDGQGGSLIHKPGIDIFDDGLQKPVRIWSRIGRRPILAGGNANGDLPMLVFASRPDRVSMRLLLDHDDARREYAYTAGAEDVLRRARSERWTVVSLKNDWKTVFPD